MFIIDRDEFTVMTKSKLGKAKTRIRISTSRLFARGWGSAASAAPQAARGLWLKRLALRRARR
jgi:hypothetical protein